MTVENKQTIAAVVVTFNRLDLLKKCIQSLREQTRQLDEIIVINNSSTDGTLDWLNSQGDLTIITQENSGSAGGQYTGIKTAYEKGYDLIWCLDHDIEINNDGLEKLLEYTLPSVENIGFLTSNIYFDNDNLAYLNIPELAKPYDVLNSITNSRPIPIISASFGSLLVPHNVIKKVGLPCKEFFIYGDDAEFTFRIIENGFCGFLILESKAKHNETENNSNPFLDMSIKEKKFIYGIRNITHVCIKRNIIVNQSRIRGYMSSFMFVIRIIRKKKILIKESFLQTISVALFSWLKGIFFKPKIAFPNKQNK